MFLDQEIGKLEVDSSVIKVLRSNEIKYIRDLWKLNRKQLKGLGLHDQDINQIMIKLQLHGVDFNRKIYMKQ